MDGRYDITIVERISKNEYKVFYIYPNEDNGLLTPVVWESHHYWDGKGTIENFSMEETSAYLYEDFKNFSEAATMFKGKNFVWYENESEIEKNLDGMPISSLSVCIYA